MKITEDKCVPGVDLNIGKFCWKLVKGEISSLCKFPDEDDLEDLESELSSLKSNPYFNSRKGILLKFDPTKTSFGKCRQYQPWNNEIADVPCDAENRKYCLYSIDFLPPTIPRKTPFFRTNGTFVQNLATAFFAL
mgnify:CR=1 FL=1